MSEPSRSPSRVALVSSSTAFGGAELYLAELVAGLSGEIEFVAYVPHASDPETVRRLTDAGARVLPLRGLARRPSVQGVRALRRALREGRPELVHVNLTDQGDGLTAALALRPGTRPAVATLNLVLPQRGGWKEQLSRRVLRSMSSVVAVSDAVRAYLQQAAVPSELVRYGRTPPTMLTRDAARRELGIDPRARAVGGLGRLDPQKGWDLLCAAAAQVRDVVPDVSITVVGGGDDPQLARAAHSAGVELAGFRADAASLLTAFDVLVVPSRYEAFGLVALEAMFAGVPVIATRVGGLPEAVGDAGLLIAPDDAAALAEAIVGLLGDAPQAAELAERGRARAAGRFAVVHMLDGTRRVYERACRLPSHE